MKKFIVIFLIILPISIFAQTNWLTKKEFYQRYDSAMEQIQQGQYSVALPELLNLKDYLEKTTVFDEYNYFLIVSGIYGCYGAVGDISTSKNHILNSLNTYERNGCKKNSYYTRQLRLFLGSIEMQLDNFDAAINCFHDLQIMFDDAMDYGESYYVFLTTFGRAYMEIKDYLSAKLYIEEAIELFEQNYGYPIFLTNKVEHLVLLYEYGNLCCNLSELNQAEKCFSTIINIIDTIDEQKKTFYEMYSHAWNGLGFIYVQQGKWEEAMEILQVVSNLPINDTFLYYTTLKNLLLCEIFCKKNEEVYATLSKFNDIAYNHALNLFKNLTDSEIDYYWAKFSWNHLFMSTLAATYVCDEYLNGVAYNNILMYTQLKRQVSTEIQDFFIHNPDVKLSEKYTLFKQLIALFSYKNIDSLERKRIGKQLYDLELDIKNSIPDLYDKVKKQCKTWKDVQISLNEKEIAIVFTYIPVVSKWPDYSYHYGAFVLKKKYEYPKLILLEDVKSINAMIADNSDPDELYVNQLYSKSGMKELYKKIWSKISKYVEDGDTIFYTPIGQISNINIDLLIDSNEIELGNSINLIRVSSTGNISNFKNSGNHQYVSSCIYGNISYDESVSEMTRESSKYNTYSGENISDALSSRSMNDRGKWGALTYTKNEIDSVYSILKDGNVTTRMYEGYEANEESFKSLDGKSPDVIHLATHGFVIDTEKKAEGNKFVANTTVISPIEGYLMWCGVMMAGSNNAWTGNFNVNNVEDGILTADEISRLDLSNTKLVVLSACETGRGVVDDVEGVLGLQRAFKKAGAQSIVMSLWKVPDEATSMLMTQFYKGLMAGTERHQALKDAMNYVKKLYPDPYYWAGFIMLD